MAGWERGESMRIFPPSNWTELDIWQYIELEQIPVVSLYFARERDVIVRGEKLIPWFFNCSGLAK